MDDNIKAKHDMMTKILSWGTIIFFLVVGYALNYHEKFEFYPTDEQKNVVKAKRDQAEKLRTESKRLKDEKNFVNSSEFNVKAAESDLQAKVSEDDMNDARNRAIGLVLAAASFFIFYLLLIFMFYRKFKTEMSDYIVSKWVALGYAIVIGLITLYNAVMTAKN